MSIRRWNRSVETNPLADDEAIKDCAAGDCDVAEETVVVGDTDDAALSSSDISGDGGGDTCSGLDDECSDTDESEPKMKPALNQEQENQHWYKPMKTTR